MAGNPYSEVASVKPSGPTDAFQNIHPVALPVAGARTAEGLMALGQGGKEAASYFGEVAADNAANQYQERANEILYGNPQKMVAGPDGKMVPETGFMGLKGRAAMDARPDVDRRLDDLRKEILGGLLTLQQRQRFDGFSRREKSLNERHVGAHADAQANVWFGQVNKATGDLALNHIAAHADDVDQVLEGRERLRSARVKQAELNGGGPELITAAVQSADRDAVAAQASAIAVRDPAKAMRIIENNKEALGLHYDDLANRFRARAEQQQGRETADWVLSGTPPPKGDDAHAVIRHFEGFREKPYWDVNHWRVGYGSDTITKADGSFHPVTEETIVTRADAERDLERRVAKAQGSLKQKIGNEAWGKLSPEARASLTSIDYNYGTAPDSVIAAARTGDPAALAAAVRGLPQQGVNAGRRASEANNIAPGEAAPRTQADLIEEVKARHMPAQAEAAAVARINRAYELQHKVETQRKAEFKQKVDDSTAEAMQTGVTSNPLPESDFTKHFGPADGAAKYADYQSDIVFGADYKSLQTMSDAEQQQFLDKRMPAPGAAGYAHAIKNQERLQKGVDAIQKQRRDDPAGSVSQMPAVQDSFAQYDPKNPASFKAVADARLAAQERLGIEPEFRSPITKAEALKLTAPLRTMLPGDESKVLRDLGTKFQQMFGDQADEALSYAIRAHKVDAEVAQQAASIVRKLRDGLPLGPADVAGLDGAKELSASERALKGEADQYQSMSDAAYGVPVPRQGPQFEGSPVIQPRNVPPAAIEFLLRNPGSDADFDKKYGTGRAKQLREKYPVAPGIP